MEKIHDFESELFDTLTAVYDALLERIRTTGQLTKEDEDELREAIAATKERFFEDTKA